MDGFYDQTGPRNRRHSNFFIANDYVFNTVQTHPDLFWPASRSIRNGKMPWMKSIAAPMLVRC